MKYITDSRAGLTSEDAVKAVGNRYDLVLIAAARVRELHQGHAAKIDQRLRTIATALTEIEQGKIGRDYLNKVKSSQRRDRPNNRY